MSTPISPTESWRATPTGVGAPGHLTSNPSSASFRIEDQVSSNQRSVTLLSSNDRYTADEQNLGDTSRHGGLYWLLSSVQMLMASVALIAVVIVLSLGSKGYSDIRVTSVECSTAGGAGYRGVPAAAAISAELGLVVETAVGSMLASSASAVFPEVAVADVSVQRMLTSLPHTAVLLLLNGGFGYALANGTRGVGIGGLDVSLCDIVGAHEGAEVSLCGLPTSNTQLSLTDGCDVVLRVAGSTGLSTFAGFFKNNTVCQLQNPSSAGSSAISVSALSSIANFVVSDNLTSSFMVLPSSEATIDEQSPVTTAAVIVILIIGSLALIALSIVAANNIDSHASAVTSFFWNAGAMGFLPADLAEDLDDAHDADSCLGYRWLQFEIFTMNAAVVKAKLIEYKAFIPKDVHQEFRRQLPYRIASIYSKAGSGSNSAYNSAMGSPHSGRSGQSARSRRHKTREKSVKSLLSYDDEEQLVHVMDTEDVADGSDDGAQSGRAGSGSGDNRVMTTISPKQTSLSGSQSVESPSFFATGGALGSMVVDSGVFTVATAESPKNATVGSSGFGSSFAAGQQQTPIPTPLSKAQKSFFAMSITASALSHIAKPTGSPQNKDLPVPRRRLSNIAISLPPANTSPSTSLAGLPGGSVTTTPTAKDMERSTGSPGSLDPLGNLSGSPRAFQSPQSTHQASASTGSPRFMNLAALTEPIAGSSETHYLKRATILLFKIRAFENIYQLTRRIEEQIREMMTIAMNVASQFSAVTVEIGLENVTVSWNATTPYPFHEVRGLMCAVHLASQLQDVSQLPWSAAVFTGVVAAGSFGTRVTTKQCILGDAVATADRLADLALMLRCPIVTTDGTYAMARAQTTCTPIDFVLLEGEETPVYEVRGLRDVETPQLAMINRGFAALAGQQFAMAANLFADFLTDHGLEDRQIARLNRLCLDLCNEEEPYIRLCPAWTVHEAAANGMDLPQELEDELMDSSPHAQRLRAPQRRRSSADPAALLRAQLEQTMLDRSATAGPNNGESFEGGKVSLAQRLSETMSEIKSESGLADDASAEALSERLMQLSNSNSDDEGMAGPSIAITGVPPGIPPVLAAAANPDQIGSPNARMPPALPENELVDARGETFIISNKTIGEGSFGIVHVGMKDDGSLCAIKLVRLPDQLDASNSPSIDVPQHVEELLSEITTLAKIKHPNIVRYLGSALKSDMSAIGIVMEYVSGGNLTRVLKNFGAVSVASVRRYTKDILQGMKHLHDKGIVHRDIGPNNVLLTIDGVCKLSDFGCSTKLGMLNHKVAGTPQYMAPEACRGEPTFASDIWSLGITVIVLLTGRLPYDDDAIENIEEFIKRMANDEDFAPQVPANVVGVSDDAWDMVKSCLKRDPSERPKAGFLLHHQFVTS